MMQPRRFVVLFLICTWVAVAETGSHFQIYHESEGKCLAVMNDGKLQLLNCNRNSMAQKFFWGSQHRIYNGYAKQCLVVKESANWATVVLKVCNEKEELQKWECKNDTFVDLKDKRLHLHYKTSVLHVCNDTQCTSKWRIYGTTESICSQPQEDLFTILGNSQGKPCMFPFKYENSWYTECTTRNKASDEPWCATVTDYNDDQKWGLCPSKSTKHWDQNSVNQDWYLINPSAQLKWHQARMSCRQMGADLLSILEPHEQNFISGLSQKHSSALLWIGLNSLSSGNGWQWVDGRPFRYLNWAPGHPSSTPGYNCGIVNTGRASFWETSDCSQVTGYICRRSSSRGIPTVHPADGNSYRCPKHWLTYRDQCFDLRRLKKVWKEALAECRRDGGDLASIHDIAEQDFIISQLGYLPTDKLWIGLNDQKIQQLFEWSDGSAVTFTKWELDEPSHVSVLKEDCVLMRGEEGKWADDNCENDFGFICKKKAEVVPGGLVTTAPGCSEGWTRHGSFCYQIGSEEKTFEDANQDCLSKDSHLVNVASRFENAFLTSLVGLRPERYFWIGLSNKDQKETFVWTSSANVRFTHFGPGLPGQQQGCVAMMTGTAAGLWDVLSCTRGEKYICKTLAQGVEPTTAPPTTAPARCADGWKPLGMRDSCYKVYKRYRDGRKTWFESQKYCRDIGGDLLSIHSELDVKHMRDSDPYDMDDFSLHWSWPDTAWIGLSALDPTSGFVWSDGSSSAFENWDDEEPNNYNGVELCGEIYSYNLKWNDRHCESLNSWICQIRKGVTPNPEPTDSPLVYNKTEDGWIVYDGTEYYINRNLHSMEEARQYCQRKSGDLVVINGESERVFLWKMMTQMETFYWRSGQYYIGLTIDLDQSVQWMDGSPTVFLAWDKDEPGFTNYDENCVVMTSGMGFWMNTNCGKPMPSVCKRASGSPPNATLPPPMSKGGCALGWTHFDGKCYGFFGKNSEEQKSWEDARNYCIMKESRLASILSEEEQVFLVSELIDTPVDMWTGLNSQNRDSHFLWSDGKPVQYLNWAKGHPYNVPYHSHHEYFMQFPQTGSPKCTLLSRHPENMVGKWKTASCLEKHGFICKKDSDPARPIPTPEPPGTQHNIGNGTLVVVPEHMDWYSANQHCKAKTANLASVPDMLIQSVLHRLAYELKQRLWIGLNTNETDGYFKWSDNWLFHFTNWGLGEPRSDLPCVFVDVDGKWKTDHCNGTYHPVCKTWSGTIPTHPPQIPGRCPDLEWIPFRGHCYKIESSSGGSWAYAATECRKLGASLVTITDPVENNFLYSNVEPIRRPNWQYWIGLYLNYQGQWVWFDDSPVDYTNWEDAFVATDRICAFLNPFTSKWGMSSCLGNEYYICKVDKVIQPPVTPSITVLPRHGGPHVYTGIIVVVLVLLVALAGLAFLFVRRRGGATITVPPSFENMLYFGSHRRPDVDILTKNMEVHPEGSQ
ncbi:macrophage mannose receptor 1-like isoform X3 [Brienomyrus brachyistius]|uniref:macrophage mannose receptor 1-like isoform X3 n=1 Tax=Brienomyrus brachyistius TaxID=42636 RepID=UPI0020B269E6|nr:macrophage mannose receptor 1-like isoform X3 [Brienomyrus brachyistius]